jgi:hypothetical protein
VADWTDEYLRMIEDCETRESRLSPWEVSFIDSLKKMLEKGYRPSTKQTDVLDDIWEKATKRG